MSSLISFCRSSHPPNFSWSLRVGKSKRKKKVNSFLILMFSLHPWIPHWTLNSVQRNELFLCSMLWVLMRKKCFITGMIVMTLRIKLTICETVFIWKDQFADINRKSFSVFNVGGMLNSASSNLLKIAIPWGIQSETKKLSFKFVFGTFNSFVSHQGRRLKWKKGETQNDESKKKFTKILAHPLNLSFFSGRVRKMERLGERDS